LASRRQLRLEAVHLGNVLLLNGAVLMLKADERLFQSRNLCQLWAGSRNQVGGRAAYETEREKRE